MPRLAVGPRYSSSDAERNDGADTDSAVPNALPVSLGAAFVGLLLGALIWRHGAAMTPDSWAYWQGSVSLLHGDGYRFFFDRLPITDWPPGYSAYLALWEKLFGVSGMTLAAANVFLGGLAAFGWSWTLLRLLGGPAGSGRGLGRPMAAAVALHVTLVTTSACTYVLADNLKYALLPWLLYASILAAEAPSGGAFLRRSVAAGLVGALMMLVHNGSASLAAAACAVALCGRVPWGQRIGGAALLGALALGPWLMLTRALGQGGSHRIGLGIANSTPLYYLSEMARGIGGLLASRPTLGCALFLIPVGLAVWGLREGGVSTGAALTRSDRRVVLLCGVFAAVAVAALYVIFNITWIQDPIDAANGRRYLLFLTLIVVPLGLMWGARHLSPVALAVLTLLVVLLPLVRTLSGIVPASRFLASPFMTGNGVPPERVGLDSTIRPDYIQRPPARDGDHVLLSPPLYPWIRQRLAPHEQPD